MPPSSVKQVVIKDFGWKFKNLIGRGVCGEVPLWIEGFGGKFRPQPAAVDAGIWVIERDTGSDVLVEQGSRMWSSNPSGKCSYERPTRDTVCGTMRSMCGADAGCLAISFQSLEQGMPPSAVKQLRRAVIAEGDKPRLLLSSLVSPRTPKPGLLHNLRKMEVHNLA